MSGHSKWSTIKRKKGALDAKRGAIFTKLGNLIAVAAREKGGDLDTNFTLRMAVDKAKASNMPKDNIERAIKRGTGELGGDSIEELYYEGIGPANSQFIVKSLTDNKNRSASGIRHIFTKFGGSLGAVMWNFEKKGIIVISKEEAEKHNLESEEKELELIESGAEDIITSNDEMIIYTEQNDLQNVTKYLENINAKLESADLGFVAKDKQKPTDTEMEKIENFIEELDECEDVADYYSNLDI